MAYWLLKNEPDCYSYDDLARDGSTLWDGITNALALKHLRTAQPGDRAFYYHTGDEKAIVGIMEITGLPYPDPEQANEKLVVVPVKPLRKFKTPVTLKQIKDDPRFASWDLVRMSRLSVVPCSEEIWQAILALAGDAEPKPKRSSSNKGG
jgi:predicted RNA-binding protein with PUA-like domain